MPFLGLRKIVPKLTLPLNPSEHLMKSRTSILIQLSFFAIAILCSLIIGRTLPDTVPIHWNLYGQVDGYGSKWITLLLMPLTILVMGLLTVGLPHIPQSRARFLTFSETYHYVMAMVSGLMLALHVIILRATEGAPFDITRSLLFVILVFFALFGDVMGKIKPNPYMGIRTPWTLGNESVWRETHRKSGKLWFWGGGLGALAVLAGVPPVATGILMVALCFWPIGLSYQIHRRLG